MSLFVKPPKMLYLVYLVLLEFSLELRPNDGWLPTPDGDPNGPRFSLVLPGSQEGHALVRAVAVLDIGRGPLFGVGGEQGEKWKWRKRRRIETR